MERGERVTCVFPWRVEAETWGFVWGNNHRVTIGTSPTRCLQCSPPQASSTILLCPSPFLPPPIHLTRSHRQSTSQLRKSDPQQLRRNAVQACSTIMTIQLLPRKRPRTNQKRKRLQGPVFTVRRLILLAMTVSKPRELCSGCIRRSFFPLALLRPDFPR